MIAPEHFGWVAITTPCPAGRAAILSRSTALPLEEHQPKEQGKGQVVIARQICGRRRVINDNKECFPVNSALDNRRIRSY